MTSLTKKQKEVDRNFEAFSKLLPDIINIHRGKYALMRAGEITGYYSSATDARTAGATMYEDGLYSIQQVSDKPIDLGFFSHAVVLG